MPFDNRHPDGVPGREKFAYSWAASTPTFPDAVARDSLAHIAHSHGLRGGGVSVLVIDKPISCPRFFHAHGYVVSPLLRSSYPSHGSAVAAALLGAAPDVHVNSADVRHAAHALRRSRADLVVCAWGMPPEPTLEGLLRDNAHRVISVRAHRRIPGSLREIRCVDDATPWPRGPYRFPDSRRSFRGLSVAVGVAGGVAALLVGAGVPVSEAIQLTVDAPTAEPFSLATEAMQCTPSV